MADALAACSVFLDDKDLWNLAVASWRARVPAYVYVAADGPAPLNRTTPMPANYLRKGWYDLRRYVDGVSQETCRDLSHVQLGLAALVNVAETAHHQGVDLYGVEQHRVVAALEFHAALLAPGKEGARRRRDLARLCGSGKFQGAVPLGTWEVAYHHYRHRVGLRMPHTSRLLETVRPTAANHHIAWETLTHGRPADHAHAHADGGPRRDAPP